MSIKAKLLLAFLSVSLIIGLLGGVVFFRDIGQAEQIAQREAAAIATAISLFASHEIEEGEISYPFGKHELQAVVENFRQIQDRNITLVDMEKNIVADALFQQVGTVFPHDSPNDEVGQTLKDGKIRAFSETCKFYPQRAKLIVAPLNLHNGTRIGAVVLEYTSLYKNLFKQARSTAEQILSVYLCALAASLAVGFLIYRHIAIPVRNLRNAALQIASGDLETKVLCRSNDELGSLAESFNLMTDNLKSTQDKLLESNSELEKKIAAHEEAERALTEMNSRLQTLIQAIPDMVFFKDTEGRHLLVNRALEEQIGMKSGTILGRTAAELLPADFAESCRESDEKALEAKHPVHVEEQFTDRWGELKTFETVKAPILDAEGSVAGLVGVSRDITKRKKMEDTIKHQAHYDFLTGLPNRSLFLEHLNFSLLQAHREKQILALMFLDLDRFKTINDTLGHTTGDSLLKEIAERMTSCIRESDLIARFGGDEFAVLLPQIAHTEDVAKIAGKLLSIFKAPFAVDGHELHVTPSIGISFFPNDGEFAEVLLKSADIAMYHAKEQGRDNFKFYSPALNIRTLEQMILENSLRQTLQRGELVVYYQPQVNLLTGRLLCAEALVRWQHPELGLLDPMHFIPLAEEIGFIIPIGEWVLRTACIQNLEWQRAGLPPLCITVNLSMRQLQQPDFIRMVAGVLHETGLAPDLLEFEITENTAMQNIELIISNLMKLSSMGIRLSIDDFGTGYSSLSYLKKLPVQKLKIDKAFIRGAEKDPGYKAIIGAIIAMAHSLKLYVVAEGVETEEQLELLRSAGCDGIQGFIFSEPLPPDLLGGMALSSGEPC